MAFEPRIAAVVVTWNHAASVARTLRALASQIAVQPSVLVIDNHSADGTEAVVRGIGGPVHLLQNPRNLGFARAANQGIAVSRTPYIALVNPDCVPEPNALRAACDALDAEPTRAAVAPWLFRRADDLSAPVPRGTVDSSGLAVTRGRRVVDRDAGRPTVERPAGPVFGASGAFAVYRRSALERVRYRNEYFDERFFAYKEDADLAWRLQRAGYSAWFEPAARAIHPRGVAGEDRGVPRHRARALPLERLSYRNHLLMLLKHETPATLLPDLPWVLTEELGKFLYHLLRRPAVLGVLPELVALGPGTRDRRRALQGSAAVPAVAVRRAWFHHAA